MQRKPGSMAARIAMTVVVATALVSAPSARSAQDDNADSRYVSPLYGYSLTYDAETWSIVLEDEFPYDRFDRVYLSNGSSLISITSHPDYGASDLAECVTTFELGLWDSSEITEREVFDEPGAAGADDTRAWQTIEFVYESNTGDDGRNIGYIECLWLGDEMTIAIRHDAPASVYEREAEERVALLAGLTPPDHSRSGEHIFAIEANRHRHSQPAPATDVYVSPTYGYEIPYDPGEWRIAGGDDDLDDEYDRVLFSNTPSRIVIWGDPDYDRDEMAGCVEEYLGFMIDTDGVSAIEPLDEADAAGEEDERAWTAFSYDWEYRPDAEASFVQYIECAWIGDGVTLVIIHEATVASYPSEVPLREALLAESPARET